MQDLNSFFEEPPQEPFVVETLIGLMWRSENPNLNSHVVFPEVIVRTGDLLPSSVQPLIGRRLRYRAMKRRLCLGHRPVGGSLEDCRRTPEAGSRRCPSCASREAGFAQKLHHSHTRDRQHLDGQMLEHLQQTNYLYLAGFRDGSIKIGTSSAGRLQTRLAEQGAWSALIVAEADDGFIVREIEDHVTEFLEIPQAVSVNRKLAGMITPISDDQLDRALAGNAVRVRQMVDALNDDRLRSSSGAWTHPRAASAVWARPFAYPLPLDEGHHDVTVVDACGRVVALQRDGKGDDVFLADIGRLYGVVTRSDHAPAPEIAVQDSLF